MSLKTFVKVGNITNLTDARYCAGMGVNQLGFNVEDPNFTVEKFKEITGWLEGIEYVAEFDKLAADKVITAVEQLGVNWVEIQNPALIGPLKDAGYNVILNVLNISGFDAGQLIEELKDHVNMFIAPKGFKGDKVLQHLITYDGGGFPEDENIRGYSLSGENEVKPGLKDFDVLMDVLEALEETD